MTVSIIVPNYNYGRFLGDCLASMDAQTSTDFEVIVVDDGSTDESRSVLAAWSESTSVKHQAIYLESNRGAPHAFNVGFAAASGEFVCFVDADDFLHPDKVEQQANMFRDVPDHVGLVYHDCHFFDDVSRSFSKKTFFDEQRDAGVPVVSGRFLEPLTKHGTLFPLLGVMVRSDLIREVGPFDESLVYCDFPLWWRLARITTAQPISRSLGAIRVHGGSMNRSAGSKVPLMVSKLSVYRRMADDPESQACERRMAAERTTYILRQLVLIDDPAARDAVRQFSRTQRAPARYLGLLDSVLGRRSRRWLRSALIATSHRRRRLWRDS